MKAIYPGTFDPITLGHLDILERSVKLFDEIVVAIYDNPGKKPLFNVDERLEMIENSIEHLPKVTVVAFENQLLVDFARQIAADVIIRGLRAISDFEAEISLAQTNRKLHPEVETILLMTDLNFSFLSSTMVKEIARLKGDIHDMVPPAVEKALKEKFN
jgi:pantetheine-phosphate adenylyltransferase